MRRGHSRTDDQARTGRRFGRRTLTALLCGSLLLAGPLTLSACGSGSDPSQEDRKPSVVRAQEQARKLSRRSISYIALGRSGGFRAASEDDIRQQLGQAGYSLNYTSVSSNDNLSQIQAFDRAVQQKPAAILLTPSQRTGWAGELRKAKQAGIPVLLVGRTISPNRTSLYTTMVGPSDTWAGRQAAKYVNSLAPSASSGPDADTDRGQASPINGLVLAGPLGDPQSNERLAGWNAALGPDAHVVASANGDWTRTSGRTLALSMLREHAKDGIRFLFALNDTMALGAAQAVQQMGLRGKVRIVSIDATRAGLRALINGDLDRVVEYNPLMGPTVMTTLTAVLSGRKVRKRVVVPSRVFTASSARKVFEDRRY